MANRNNYGFGQIVLQGELDGSFDDLEAADLAQVLDSGQGQVPVAASPGPDIYGAINRGLIVTRSGTDDFVSITGGTAYDNQGRRISLETAATVKLTAIGITTPGATADATAAGAALTLSVPAGEYAVVSLFIAYDEILSGQRKDGNNQNYYFVLSESFHFELAVSTPWTPPLTGTPGRQALADNKILLADLVVENNGGSINVISNGVCTTTKNWVGLAGFYAGLTGRRSDWFAIEGDATDHPAFLVGASSFRYGTAREALWSLLQLLQGRTTVPTGSEVIGIPADAGLGSTFSINAPVTIAAGHIKDAITTLLGGVNAKFSRGGDTVRPQAGAHGIVLDPQDMDEGYRLIHMLSQREAGPVSLETSGSRRGHMGRPHMVHDHFNYVGDPTAGTSDLPFTHDGTLWGLSTVGAQSTANAVLAPGGVVELWVRGTTYDACDLIHGYNSGSGVLYPRWYLKAHPYVKFDIRFLVPSLGGAGLDNVEFDIRLQNTSNFLTGTGTRAGLLYQDNTAGGMPNKNLYLYILGAGGTHAVALKSLAVETWYRAVVTVMDPVAPATEPKVVAQIAEEGTALETEVAVDPTMATPMALTYNADPYNFGAKVRLLALAAAPGRALWIDYVTISDAELRVEQR